MPNILLIEDERVFIQAMLITAQHRQVSLSYVPIMRIADGRTVSYTLKIAEDFDAIIVGGYFPGTPTPNGEDLIRMLRQGGITLPIIATSGRPEREAALCKAGATAFAHQTVTGKTDAGLLKALEVLAKQKPTRRPEENDRDAWM